MKEKNIHPHHHSVNRFERNKLNQHRSFIIWLTGLSGSGKSTLANLLLKHLHINGIRSYLLDGDNLRSGLNQDLSFTADDRRENIRRTAEVGKLMIDAGLVVITAFITPFEKERQFIKSLLGKDVKIVYVQCSLEECERRDPKGLYKKARKGEIQNFTGISQPFETPVNPDLTINTSSSCIEDCLNNLIHFITPELSIKKEEADKE